MFVDSYIFVRKYNDQVMGLDDQRTRVRQTKRANIWTAVPNLAMWPYQPSTLRVQTSFCPEERGRDVKGPASFHLLQSLLSTVLLDCCYIFWLRLRNRRTNWYWKVITQFSHNHYIWNNSWTHERVINSRNINLHNWKPTLKKT